MHFRPAAVPLAVCDPYFSIWSYTNNLYDDYTRHWTGRIYPMLSGIYIDEKFYTLMGIENGESEYKKTLSPYIIEQKSLKITPLSTIYYFENDIVGVELKFTTPLLLDRLDIFSRTASYIEYNITVRDEKQHDIRFVFAMSAECCLNDYSSEVAFKKEKHSVSCGKVKQKALSEKGDMICIDWGRLHVAQPDAKIISPVSTDWMGNWMYKELDMDKKHTICVDHPYILVEKQEHHGVITIAYDEIKAVEYFGEKLDEYFKSYYRDFDEMLCAAVNEYNDIIKLCDEFDKKLLNDASVFGEKYSQIAALAYRQVCASHKLVKNSDGKLIFLSKECGSNGCIGTLDITYPSTPLFLKYNPELVTAMLRPIIKYAKSEEWEYDFAPHDVGQYPIANGQVYCDNKIEYQMPVEECGNMLICACAAEYAGCKDGFAAENQDILKKWADYLLQNGYNPGQQLCTDDFAGPFAQNCNLSIKGIIGIAAYGKMFNESKYTEAAKAMAKQWQKEAANQKATRLAFDKEDTWSLKYNIVWDKLLGLKLFDETVFENEIGLYKSKMNRYGVPLDCRADYTKMDWLMWTTAMTKDNDYFNDVVSCIYDMICTTVDRVPMTDWYCAKTGRRYGTFQNRSVLGGIFIKLLELGRK